MIGKSILIGSGFVGACILAHLGYTVYRDRLTAQASRLEQEKQTRLANDRYRRIQSKEAWKRSLVYLDFEFKKWLLSEKEKGQTRATFELQYEGNWANFVLLEAKEFNISDIEWKDDRHVVVHGFLSVFGNQYLFSWRRNMELISGTDERWEPSDPSSPVFEYTKIGRESEAVNRAFACAVESSTRLCIETLVNHGRRSPLVEPRD